MYFERRRSNRKTISGAALDGKNQTPECEEGIDGDIVSAVFIESAVSSCRRSDLLLQKRNPLITIIYD